MITVILFDDEITGYCGADSLIILRKGRSPGRLIFEDWYTVCPLLLAWVPVTGGGGGGRMGLNGKTVRAISDGKGAKELN